MVQGIESAAGPDDTFSRNESGDLVLLVAQRSQITEPHAEVDRESGVDLPVIVDEPV